jgi:ubiquinone/menaquinone biosynthesis C-methylase UbiE
MEEQMKYFFEIYGTLPRAGPGDDASTAKAYKMIPGLPDKPKILDIGCGPGKQTLELARLSKGKITALDNHQPFLDKIARDAKAAGLSQYIETINQDMNQMSFPAASFDLAWSEGALYIMGFENALIKCRELLKRNGALAATDMVWLTDNPSPAAREFAKEYESMKNIPDNLELFKKNGYKVLGHFTLPASSWFAEYYDPMQERINELRPKYEGDQTARAVIDMAQKEIDGFKQCSEEIGYEFFIAGLL